MGSTKKAQKALAVRRGVNGKKESELQISLRPQFRASNVMAHALALYNLETAHTVSQTMNMALRQFLPMKYATQAEQLLRNGNGRIGWLQNAIWKFTPSKKLRNKQDLNHQQITDPPGKREGFARKTKQHVQCRQNHDEHDQ